MAMESMISPIWEKIVDRLFNAAGRQLGYFYHYYDNMDALRKQVKTLEDKRDRVQGKIDAANRNGEIIEADVKTWIARGVIILEEVQKFLEDEAQANKRCLKGWCIDFRACYRFSKGARKKKEAIDQFLKEGNFDTVSRSCPHPPIIFPVLEFSSTLESRKLIMKQIIQDMKDYSVHIIGICGMMGVGKTTLVKEFCKQAQENKVFDATVMTVVSNRPSVMTLQKDIADMLGLKLPDDNELARAGYLWARIKKEKRILIIFDDVWERIEMEKIGIPSGINHRGCKIVFTSRSKDVCNDMDAQKIFSVEKLSAQESWVLFREAAGPNIDNHDINPYAIQISAKCDGLPIAIVTIGRALKKKKKFVWMDAAGKLKRSASTSIKGMEEKIISALELSYKYLESEEAQSLFLLCCLFPEDYCIPLEELVRYGTGLKLFQDVDTVEEARVRANALVSSLTSSFLLIADDDQKYVKMHDVIRDGALTIAPRYNHKFMVKACTRLREWPSKDVLEDLTGISLMSNSIHELPDGLECPKLQALLLQKNSALVVPDNFFQGMEDLKVLDLSNTKLLSLPLSLRFLAKLRSLCLNGCKLRGLSVLGNLTNLEILSLSYSDIVEIPKDFGQLTHLRLFDLTYCEELKFISNGVISCLHKLEELYMRGSFDGWDLTGNARVIELKALSYLSSLHICIPDVRSLPNNMPKLTLTSFTIGIGVTSYELRKFQSPEEYSRSMMLSNDMRNSVNFDWVKILLESTQNMIFIGVVNSENILSDLISLTSQEFNNLKSLTLTNCKDVKYLLKRVELTAPVIFKELEVLQIDDNPMFEMCHGQLPAESFNKVKKLEVRCCHNILNIVPSHLLQRLENLETFEAVECKLLVHVFDVGRLDTVTAETKLLSKLKKLKLWSLPEMTNIWNGDTRFISLCNLKTVELFGCMNLTKLFAPHLVQSLISLEELTIEECDKLEEVFGEKEAENQAEELTNYQNKSSACLGNLSSIYIHHCDKLKNLFTPTISKNLVMLKKLEVLWCKTLEEIIINEEGEKGVSTERIVFPSLNYLCLISLDSLTCFCSGFCVVEYPALEDVKIANCPKMKTFGYGNQLTPKLRKVKQFDMNDKGQWKGNLNDTVKQLFNERAMIQDGNGILVPGILREIPID